MNFDQNNESNFEIGPRKTLISNIGCVGMNVDKFGNLFFVDNDQDTINFVSKLEISEVEINSDYSPQFSVKYSSNTHDSVKNVQAIEIEREYLYWSNSEPVGEHGALHKGFTEPFIAAAPFQSYETTFIKNVVSMDSNLHFLFYTGSTD